MIHLGVTYSSTPLNRFINFATSASKRQPSLESVALWHISRSPFAWRMGVGDGNNGEAKVVRLARPEVEWLGDLLE